MIDSAKWIKVTVPCDLDSRESVSNYFFETGCNGVEETENGVNGFFPPSFVNGKFKKNLIVYLSSLKTIGLNVQNPVYENIPDEDWSENWRVFFKPVQVTPMIVVKPPWEKWLVSGDQIVIDIDPKMAFGTGTHETTQLCLELLEQIFQSGRQVLDMGSGSAVLSIAAAKMGASRVLGVEIDPVAADNARENVRLNGVDQIVEIRTGSIEQIGSETFDIIIANMNRKILTQLIHDFHPFCVLPTQLILSGILYENRKRMENVINNSGFSVQECKRKGEWAGFICTN